MMPSCTASLASQAASAAFCTSAIFGAGTPLAASFIVALPLHNDITISGTIGLAGATAEIPS